MTDGPDSGPDRFQTERQDMLAELAALRAERNELIARLIECRRENRELRDRLAAR